MLRTHIKYALALLFCGLVGCVNEAASQAAFSTRSSSSNTSSTSTSSTNTSSTNARSSASAQAMLTSPSGKAMVDGDTVELRGGELSVNGVSYGAVAPGTHVRYVKSKGTAKMFVGEEERHPRAAK